MGELVSIVTKNHLSTNRDYLGRVNDPEFPKWKAAELAKKYDFDYWDGDRRINYGGYRYKPGYWNPVAKDLITRYKLTSKSKVLDIGCGKGFLLFEILELLPGIEIYGLDISSYAIENAHPEVKNFVAVGTATELNYSNDYFDLAFSINTLHNLYNYELEKALLEMQRVAKKKFLCVESYRTEHEKSNLIYWQVTCEAFNTPREWNWWFEKTNFEGDYEFIYFQ
jgi:protein-L-isoaspartate(D-aspartate) O-methyltransferase